MLEGTARPLQGKVALVTGGARGLGRAQAAGLARAGADVVLIDIARESSVRGYRLGGWTELDEAAQECRRHGVRALGLPCDVRDSGTVRTAVDATVHYLGGIDILVCNAGICSVVPLLDLTEAGWDTVIDVNLKGTWLVCKHVIPVLKRRAAGRIIFISSGAALGGSPGMAHYAASKAGQLGLMRNLAVELGPCGITVNSILPGSIETGMNRGMAQVMGIEFEQLLQRWKAANVLPGMLEPCDVAEAVVWLASAAARFVTGAMLAVNAGARA